MFINEKKGANVPTISYMVSAVKVFETTWSQDNEKEVDLMKRVLKPEIFVKRKLECNNSCEDDTILEPESSDSYEGITFFEEHRTLF